MTEEKTPSDANDIIDSLTVPAEDKPNPESSPPPTTDTDLAQKLSEMQARLEQAEQKANSFQENVTSMFSDDDAKADTAFRALAKEIGMSEEQIQAVLEAQTNAKTEEDPDDDPEEDPEMTQNNTNDRFINELVQTKRDLIKNQFRIDVKAALETSEMRAIMDAKRRLDGESKVEESRSQLLTDITEDAYTALEARVHRNPDQPIELSWVTEAIKASTNKVAKRYAGGIGNPSKIGMSPETTSEIADLLDQADLPEYPKDPHTYRDDGAEKQMEDAITSRIQLQIQNAGQTTGGAV